MKQNQSLPKTYTYKKFTRDDTYELVTLYVEYECLWNPNHPGYKNRQARNDAESEIVTRFGKEGFGIADFKRKVKNLRTTYQQEIVKTQQSIEKNPKYPYVSNIRWFSMLDDIMKRVKSEKSADSPVAFVVKLLSSEVSENGLNASAPDIAIATTEASNQSEQSVIQMLESIQPQTGYNEKQLSSEVPEERLNTSESEITISTEKNKEANNQSDQPVIVILESVQSVPPQKNQPPPKKRTLPQPITKKKKFKHIEEAVKELNESLLLDDEKQSPSVNHAFGAFVGASLDRLPPMQAVMAQNDIHNVLMKYRLQALSKESNSKETVDQGYYVYNFES